MLITYGADVVVAPVDVVVANTTVADVVAAVDFFAADTSGFDNLAFITYGINYLDPTISRVDEITFLLHESVSDSTLLIKTLPCVIRS